MKKDISLSIDLSKVDETAYYYGKNGKKYLSLLLKLKDLTGKVENGVLVELGGTPSQYGHNGFMVQEIPRDRKAKGEKGPIVGNAKLMDWENKPSEHQQAKANGYVKPDAWDDDGMSDVPF